MTPTPSPPTAPHRTLVTRAGVRRGFIAAQPLAIGVLVYGITFGLLAHGAGIVVCVSTVVLLNARYLLYGATRSRWL
ncbi:MAG: hypothetical protein ABI809_09145 [Caldimonas sp.]